MMHQASIEANASQAESIALALEEAVEPAAVAVGLFDRGHGRFEIFAHYEEPPTARGSAAADHAVRRR